MWTGEHKLCRQDLEPPGFPTKEPHQQNSRLLEILKCTLMGSGPRNFYGLYAFKFGYACGRKDFVTDEERQQIYVWGFGTSGQLVPHNFMSEHLQTEQRHSKNSNG